MGSMSHIPPEAVKKPRRIEQLGRVRTDDYAWMKDENWQAVLRNPSALQADIRAHLLAENAYTAGVLADTASLQAQLFDELKGRLKQDESTLPTKDGPFAYYRRYQHSAEHPLYVRTPSAGGAEEILLDADEAGRAFAYHSIAASAHSPDHRLFAYAEDVQGSEVYRVLIKDIATGAVLPNPIEPCTGNFCFSPDSRYIFWTFRDDHGRPTRMYRRAVGSAEDVLVYAEPDEGFFLSVRAARSGGSIFIVCGNQETSEVWRIPGHDPTGAPIVIEPRSPGIKYAVEDRLDHLVLRTNADGATDFKIVQAPIATPGRAHWRDVVPHHAGRYITGMAALAQHIIHGERVSANDRIVITRRDGSCFTIEVDEPAYMLRLEAGYEYDTARIRYVYSSPTTPSQWFDYNLTTQQKTLLKSQEIPTGHDPDAYVTKRLMARATDGVLIPITLLMRRETKCDGSAPVHLYGYGSYGISMMPAFSPHILSLVDRGWIHAIAHIRGGTEKGWDWFLQGRGAKKTNSFTDFIAVAEHLIATDYARAQNIVAHGGSAGGLLMGAVMNMRPDLWGGIIAAVPFVDVLNTMSDISLPLTPPEWPEWGNPLTDAQAYDVIASYSPYDNIAAQSYPPILATGGLSDPRVTYWEPAKFIAKLRALGTGSKPALLKINMDAGHGGAAGRFDILKEIALNYAFAIWALDAGFATGLD
ncbi:MAG: S9 family peptidase [Rhodospirillales bacterium 20-60-12]|nr:MAG: S9 family peptidase [Rhodospirillales bacterium 20-60-12]